MKLALDLAGSRLGKWRAAVIAGAAALSLSGGTAVGTAGPPRLAEGFQAFYVGWMYDGTDAIPVEEAVIVTRDGMVVTLGRRGDVFVPPEAEVVDLGDRFLVPGLVNAHGHVNGERDVAERELRQYAHYGVTTIVSLGGESPDAFELRDAQRTPHLDRARLLVAGSPVNPTTADEAREQVAAAADLGVDWVKIRVDDGLDTRAKMSPEIYSEVVAAAHARDLPVAVHLVELEDALGVVRAGADLVAHSVRDTAVSQELIDEMLAADACLVPTLMREISTFVYARRPFFFDDPFLLEGVPEELDGFMTPAFVAQQSSPAAEYWRRALPVAQQNLRRLHQAGVGIALGTDTGSPGRFQGYFEHLELEMMVQAGLWPEDAIHAATGGAAACIGLDGTVGTIEPGAWADFLVLDMNPFHDILATRGIHSVWVAGNRVR